MDCNISSIAAFQVLPIPPEFPPDQFIVEDHRRELRRLDDIAFTFLNVTNGDTAEAEKLLDDFISLLFEDGALSTWRYRIVLSAIRGGL